MDNQRAEGTIDIFVSYARADNEDGWINGFLKNLQDQHARYSPIPLRFFFDVTDIRVMQDWRLRVLSAVTSCHVMIAFVSSNYFNSEWCRMEWEEFVRTEVAFGTSGGAIAPIYITTTQDLDSKSDPSTSEWILDLRRRQCLDARRWRIPDSTVFDRPDVALQLELLAARV